MVRMDFSASLIRAEIISGLSAGQEYIKSMTVDQVTGSGIGFCLRITQSGELLIAGEFWGQVDFDPGSGTALSTANGFNSDSYIVKLNSFDGTYVSHIVFGGACMDARLLHEF